MPLVVADIGNSRIKWGRAAASSGPIDTHVSLPADDPAAWAAQIAAWKLQGESWLVASVQPKTRERFVQWLQKENRTVTSIESFRQLPLEIAVDNPQRVGIDRLLNAVAANARRTPGQRALIVDAGSAVTVDLVDEAGVFRGGAIFPGLRLMARALHDHTAQLPIVEINDRREPPGTSTIAAIETGVFHAVVGGIDRLLAEMRAANASNFFTGGDALILSSYLSVPMQVWPEMTLEGIRLTAVSQSPTP